MNGFFSFDFLWLWILNFACLRSWFWCLACCLGLTTPKPIYYTCSMMHHAHGMLLSMAKLLSVLSDGWWSKYWQWFMCCYFLFFCFHDLCHFAISVGNLDFTTIAIGPNNAVTKPCVWNFDTKVLLVCVGLPCPLVCRTSLVRFQFHHMDNSSQHEKRRS